MDLDDAYANAAHIPGAEAFPPRWEAAAAAFRKTLGARAELGVSYGPSDRQAYDFFHPQGVARGTLIFVHGGYWKAFDRSVWSHLAAGAIDKGWAVAMPSYDLCPDVRISEITRQIAAAVTAIAERTQGDIVLAGHSAGGHLVARMLDPLVLPDSVRSRIARVVPISPIADLAPLMQTSMNDILRIDTAEAQAESPINMAVPRGPKLSVWVGADERPAFLEQAEALARTWGATHVVVAGKHHFDVIDALADPKSDLTALLTDT
ncbi:alpha/beta hydrolase [Sulfitobacter sabulilitoris]|uniref:Alpha/beta hydrolase n=1 Tax=Sulfitobacter sabulilitoris TaxID=2562655 RepID=A0A5S3PFC3_9RHOB|nr:alpha/beta hydrolase [Sulfitobacter sabulilitoris]TMM52762.1 alpha/beta hydrolase [Sulfitobacter sabulilitoris]